MPFSIYTFHTNILVKSSKPKASERYQPVLKRNNLSIFRAAFEFGPRVHFALRRKMRKSPVVRLPAFLSGLYKSSKWRNGPFL